MLSQFAIIHLLLGTRKSVNLATNLMGHGATAPAISLRLSGKTARNLVSAWPRGRAKRACTAPM